jgi:serine/threonine-protein kinase
MATIDIDNVSFELRKTQNFLWLKELGNVFCVFDQQDSGNISFGVQDGEKKYFVKYAGAQTVEYEGNTQTAIDNLNKAVTVYEDLRHENIIDSITNVYTMGILLFGLIGSESDHSFEKWEGSRELYELACKAILPERKLRFQSIEDFYGNWKQVVSYVDSACVEYGGH